MIPWTCSWCGSRFRGFLPLAGSARRTWLEPGVRVTCGGCICNDARPGARQYALGLAGKERLLKRALEGCVFTFRLVAPGRPLGMDDFQDPQVMGPRWTAWWTQNSDCGNLEEVVCHGHQVPSILFGLAREYNQAGLEPPELQVEARLPHYKCRESIRTEVQDSPPFGRLAILGVRLRAHLEPFSTMLVDALGRRVID